MMPLDVPHGRRLAILTITLLVFMTSGAGASRELQGKRLVGTTGIIFISSIRQSFVSAYCKLQTASCGTPIAPYRRAQFRWRCHSATICPRARLSISRDAPRPHRTPVQSSPDMSCQLTRTLSRPTVLCKLCHPERRRRTQRIRTCESKEPSQPCKHNDCATCR